MESSFHFSTSSLKAKNTNCKFHIGHRLFYREVCKYVSHSQCINTGKRRSGKKRVNLFKHLVPADARNECEKCKMFIQTCVYYLFRSHRLAIKYQLDKKKCMKNKFSGYLVV